MLLKATLKVRAVLTTLLAVGTVWAIFIAGHYIPYTMRDEWFWAPYCITAALVAIAVFLLTINAWFKYSDAE